MCTLHVFIYILVLIHCTCSYCTHHNAATNIIAMSTTKRAPMIAPTTAPTFMELLLGSVSVGYQQCMV